MRVLIAEDEPVSRRKLELALAQWGFEVVATSDGIQALERLDGEAPPSLAILDVIMPGLNGFDVCRRIRQLPRLIPPYLIMLTGNSDKEDVVEGLEAGANDYVIKPFDPAELRARVNVGLEMLE